MCVEFLLGDDVFDGVGVQRRESLQERFFPGLPVGVERIEGTRLTLGFRSGPTTARCGRGDSRCGYVRERSMLLRDW